MTENMTLEGLEKVCNILSSKYNNPQEKGDLFSEGYIAGLESIQENHPKETTYGLVRAAMQSYYNLKRSPVSVPVSGDALKAASSVYKGEGTEAEASFTQVLLLQAVRGVVDEIKPNTLGGTLSSEEVLVGKETREAILSVCSDGSLSAEEAFIIRGILTRDKSVDSLGKEIGLNRSTTRRRYLSAVETLSKKLTME